MITLEQIEKQFARMDDLDFTPGSLVELTKAASAAYDEKTLEIVVTNWLGQAREWPKPADLGDMIRNQNERRQPPRQCGRCRGNGVYGGHMGGIYGRWRFCGCPLGLALFRSEPDAVDRLNAANDRAAAGGAL